MYNISGIGQISRVIILGGSGRQLKMVLEGRRIKFSIGLGREYLIIASLLINRPSITRRGRVAIRSPSSLNIRSLLTAERRSEKGCSLIMIVLLAISLCHLS